MNERCRSKILVLLLVYKEFYYVYLEFCDIYIGMNYYDFFFIFKNKIEELRVLLYFFFQ